MAEVIDAVRHRGDAALLEYTTRFDRWSPADAAALEIAPARLRAAWDGLPVEQCRALERAGDYPAALRELEEARELADGRGAPLDQARIRAQLIELIEPR